MCGWHGATARVLDTGDGPRWLDLCWRHSMNIHQPSPGMPTTMEGIVADLQLGAEKAGVDLTILTDEDFLDDCRG
ncbi:hypothetical protein FNV65_35195 [Streptomyces sp. S1A1-8]|uniref:hypothetical protein n=1 Tax=unclassified Streptomyces TaxID=2593676 RepID=UPI001165A124|nr:MULTISPECIES: hypothetical protein [unclassified Streptomyces]QDO00760.1 hypothetical protein FNV58_36615 [Streptomyces sp. RLB1-9]QDO22490.1 hypothetical protein FNV65_35195 [Streptomyces sp. S1A1-8]QDO32617.1 hypothetical protein FNV63_35215 [Streptomyces sp. S1A1-3]